MSAVADNTKRRRGAAMAAAQAVKRLRTTRSSALIPFMDEAQLTRFLPKNLIKLIRDSQTRPEWESKVRFLIGFLFYRGRAYSEPTIQAMLPFLQPIEENVVATETEGYFIQSLIAELQNDFYASHEFVARAFLGSSEGSKLLKALQSRKVTRRKVFQELPAVLESTIPFSASEVALLWTGILCFVHPDHWNPSKWGPESRITRDYYDQMRTTSYALIARYADAMTKGGKLVTPLSVDSRSVDFFQTSNFESQFEWPQLPPEMPKTQQQWEARGSHYSVHTDHVTYSVFQRKFREFGQLPPPIEIVSDHDSSDNDGEPHPESVTRNIASVTETPVQTQTPTPVVSGPVGRGDAESQVATQETGYNDSIDHANTPSNEDPSQEEGSENGGVHEPDEVAASEDQKLRYPECSDSQATHQLTDSQPRSRLSEAPRVGDHQAPMFNFASDPAEDYEEIELDADDYDSPEQEDDCWDLTDIGPSVPMEYGSERNLVSEETFHRIVQMAEVTREEQRRLAYEMMDDIEPAHLIAERTQTLATLGVHGVVAFAEELLDQSNARANEIILALNTLISNNNKEKDRLVQKAQEERESRQLIDKLKAKFRGSSTRLSEQRHAAIEHAPPPMTRAPLLPQGMSRAGANGKTRLGFGSLTGARVKTHTTIPQSSRRREAGSPPGPSFSSSSGATSRHRPSSGSPVGQSSGNYTRNTTPSVSGSSVSGSANPNAPNKAPEYRDPLHDRMLGHQP